MVLWLILLKMDKRLKRMRESEKWNFDGVEDFGLNLSLVIIGI